MDKNLIDRTMAAHHATDPDELKPDTANIGITHEMLATHRSPAARYFVDEVGGEYFMIPVEHRLDWYAFEQLMEEGHGPEPLPDYAHPVESLCHLEFACPEEPFV